MKRILNMFHFLFSLHLITSQFCGLNPPRDQTDCFNYQFNGTDCCYLYNENESLCLKIQSPDQILPGSSYTFNNTQFQINCNTTSFLGQIGTPCGVSNPQNSTQCSNASTSSNNCCYYNNAITSYCFWLGQEFSNEIYFLSSLNNTTVVCHSAHLKLDTYKIVIILAFILFFN